MESLQIDETESCRRIADAAALAPYEGDRVPSDLGPAQNERRARIEAEDLRYKEGGILPRGFHITGSLGVRDMNLVANSGDGDAWTSASSRPVVTGKEIAAKAKELGESEPQRWRSDERHNIYRCNQFLDAALRAVGAELPWAMDKVPTVHLMRAKLAQDGNYQMVSSAENRDFDKYHGQVGDIVIWDFVPPHYPTESPHRMEHCGILDGDQNLLYSGSTRSHGYDVTPFKELKKLYGAPTAIFRCTGQDR